MDWVEFYGKQDLPKVIKPWGEYADHIRTEDVVIKTLVIKPKQAISYQRHFMRSEFWYIVSGSGLLKTSPEEAHSKEFYMVERISVGQSRLIDEGVAHQVLNDSEDTDLIIVEMQIGTALESDIERIEDMYGRQ